jgi:hypothetical protein
LKFLRYEARTQTIRTWTGFSDDRIRNLCRSHMSPQFATPPQRAKRRSKESEASRRNFGQPAHQIEIETIAASRNCATWPAVP